MDVAADVLRNVLFNDGPDGVDVLEELLGAAGLLVLGGPKGVVDKRIVEGESLDGELGKEMVTLLIHLFSNKNGEAVPLFRVRQVVHWMWVDNCDNCDNYRVLNAMIYN